MSTTYTMGTTAGADTLRAGDTITTATGDRMLVTGETIRMTTTVEPDTRNRHQRRAAVARRRREK